MNNTTSTVPLTGVARKPLFGPAEWIAMVLMIVGGLNWALVGLLGVDLVATIFGPMTMMSRIVYCLVGLGALYGIVIAARLGQHRD